MSSSPFVRGSNPFLTGSADVFAEPSQESAEAKAGYAMIPSASIDASEVESAASAVEVMVRWDDAILHVGHLPPGRAFHVGEDCADVVVPADKLGSSRMSLVSADGSAFIPQGATATLTVGARTLSLADATTEGLAQPAAGGHSVRLSHGMRVKSELAGFVFEVASVNAGRKVAGKGRGDKRAFGAQALSFGLHGAIAAALFAFMPALASTEDGQMSDDQKYMLSAMLKAQAETEKEQPELKGGEETKASDGGAGAPSPGEKGALGSNVSKASNKAYAVTGGAKERTLNRAEMLEDARNFGMIDLLGNVPSSVSSNGPVSPWGDVANGPDAIAANGNMWGEELGDAFGQNGLDLSGVGEGAGGKWNGIGMGGIDTIGHGSGSCTDANCQGFGNFNGRLRPSHTASSPKVRMSPPSISGRIPPEVIQRIVRQSFGRFRGCYEAGLRTNPSLSGVVSVAFTIGRDGAVGGASGGGSLPDAAVVKCVTQQFYGLSFPAPDGGIVTVSYPISFNPN